MNRSFGNRIFLIILGLVALGRGDGRRRSRVVAALAYVLAQRFRRDPSRTRARFLADLLAPAEREALGPARLAALDAAMAPPDPGAAQAGLEILATADLRAELGAIDLPVLLVHGSEDPICPAGASRAMAGAIRGAELSILPGAGHAPFLTREDEVAAAVLAFPGRPR